MTEPSGVIKKGRGAHHQTTRRAGGAAPPWAAPGTLLAAMCGPSTPPSPIFTPRGGNPKQEPFFANSSLISAAIEN